MFFNKRIFDNGLTFIIILLVGFSAFDAFGSDDEGVYLGEYGGSEYNPDSTNNEYGQYGSEYAVDSINNEYGRYGSEYSTDSANNPYSTSTIKLYAD